MRAFSFALRNLDSDSVDFHASVPTAAEANTHITLSPWSQSATKRVFDCACIVAALPLLIPVLLLVALAVRLTSRGPVFFLQQRIGCGGRPFTIFKFRTLKHCNHDAATGRRFTCIGRFLRLWKLDELPQLANVLLGDLSLVGPRPKMREYELHAPQCRPGITGAATIVFAREEELLEQTPALCMGESYRSVVMPAKLLLDAEYMARATFLSDLRLIAATVLRRWDSNTLQALLGAANLDPRHGRTDFPADAASQSATRQGPLLPQINRSAEQVTDL